MQPNIQEISRLADQVAAAHGLAVLDVKLAQQGKSRTVEITICKSDARVGLSDCEQVSRDLEKLLDEQSPPLIDGSFVLEVQSPGTDRKLSSQREFKFFQGQPVEVKTKQKVDGLGSAFTGKLAGLQGDRVLIEHPQKVSDKPAHKQNKNRQPASTATSVEVDMDNVIHVRLMPPAPTGNTTE